MSNMSSVKPVKVPIKISEYNVNPNSKSQLLSVSNQVQIRSAERFPPISVSQFNKKEGLSQTKQLENVYFFKLIQLCCLNIYLKDI